MSSFTPDLLRQSPFDLKRCLQSQKKLKLSLKYSEWTVHVVESHVFSANSLLQHSHPKLEFEVQVLAFSVAFYFLI